MKRILFAVLAAAFVASAAPAVFGQAGSQTKDTKTDIKSDTKKKTDDETKKKSNNVKQKVLRPD